MFGNDLQTVTTASRAREKFRLIGGAQPLLLVPVRVNEGGSFQFILDAGAGTSILSPELADSLQIKSTGTKQGETAGGPVNVRLAHPAKPLILIEAHVNDRGPFQFAIDSGTSATAISPELARDLGLQGSPIGPATAGGAQSAMTAARTETLRVGRAEVRGLAVVIGEFLAMLSQVVGRRLDGIVGYNFLRNFKVAIDYPNESFSLFSR
jgi:predicted aspartyl protease